MKTYINKLLFVTFLLFAALFLASCGSGSGSGSGSEAKVLPVTADNTGSVAILLTDSPTNDFSEINITVTKIELMSDSSKATVFSGNRIINLLDLNNLLRFIH